MATAKKEEEEEAGHCILSDIPIKTLFPSFIVLPQ